MYYIYYVYIVHISIMDIYLKYILEAYMNKVDILIKHTHISVY